MTSQADSEPRSHSAELETLIEREAQVPPALAGLRLDRIAAELFEEHSRAELTRWIRAGELLVDGETAPAKRKLNGGEQLTLSGTPRELPDWQAAQALEFEVLYADADVAVINKPAGLVVHPGAGQSDGTLVNGLLHRFAQAEGEDPRHLARAGVVHRLDKDTSGLMVVGRNTQAILGLTEAMAAREVRREYLAMLRGYPRAGLMLMPPLVEIRAIERDRRWWRTAKTRSLTYVSSNGLRLIPLCLLSLKQVEPIRFECIFLFVGFP